MGSSNTTPAAEGEKKVPACKICCACPTERRMRDECTLLKNMDQCEAEINAFYTCLLKEGFSQDERRLVSLKDIAAAFGEMASTPSPTGRDDSHRRDTGRLHSSSVPATHTTPSSPSSRQRTYASATRNPSRPTAAALTHSGQDRGRSTGSPSTSPDARTRSRVVGFALGHAQRLATLTGPQLLAEMESSYRRVHLSDMVLSLMELSRRVDLVTRAVTVGERVGHEGDEVGVVLVPIAEYEAAGESGWCPHPSSSTATRATQAGPAPLEARFFCRSDNMLEAALRCLTKMNLAQLDSDIQLAVRAAHELGDGGAPSGTTGSGALVCRGGGEDDLCRHARTLADEAHGHALAYFAHPHDRDFPHQLSRQLLAWLSARVAVLDVRRAVTLVHLLVQQRLFACDDILTTLVDTLVVRTGEASTPHSSGGAHGGLTAPSQTLSINEYAILFDAMARSETAINFSATRWRQARLQKRARERAMSSGADRSHNSGPDGDTAEEAGGLAAGESAADSSTGRPGDGTDVDNRTEPSASLTDLTSEATLTGEDTANTWHPLYSTEVYSELARGLMRCVTRRGRELQAIASRTRAERDAATPLFPTDTNNPIESAPGEPGVNSMNPPPSTTPHTLTTTGAGVWATVDPVTFFFLTRALGKLSLLDPALIPCLLPGMAAYLRSHPEQYLGILLLVGRPGNTVVDAELTQTLVHTLTARLRKRRRALATSTAAGQGSGGEGEWGEAMLSDLSPGVGPLTGRGEGVGGGPDVSDAYGDDEDSLGLLSEHPAQPPRPRASAEVGGARPHAPPAADIFAVSLIDIFSFHRFLGCLCQQYVQTRSILRGRGADTPRTTDDTPLTEDALHGDMVELYALLLDDVHRGVPSLSSLARMPPILLEQTLVRVLEAHHLLLPPPTRAGVHGDESAAEPSRPTAGRGDGLWYHPLLMELAYVWTQHVAHGRLVVRSEAHGRHTEGDPPSRPGITASLLAGGVLERRTLVRRRGAAKQTGGRYRSESRTAAREVAPHAADGTDPAVLRVPCYVMPLPRLRAHAPRVLAAVSDAVEAREARRQRRLASRGSRWVTTTTAAAAATRPSLKSEVPAMGDDRAVREQTVRLARHFDRFSTAVGCDS